MLVERHLPAGLNVTMLRRMNEMGRFLSSIAVILFAGVVFGLARSKLDFGNVADWAQAFGAVAAIWSGFELATRQRRESDRAQAKNRAERRIQGHQAALDIGGHAQQVLRSATELFQDPFETPQSDGVELIAKRIDGVVWQIDRYDLSEVRRLEILADVVQLRMLLLQASDSLRDIYGGSGIFQSRLETTRTTVSALAESAGVVLKRLNNTVAAELGHTGIVVSETN